MRCIVRRNRAGLEFGEGVGEFDPSFRCDDCRVCFFKTRFGEIRERAFANSLRFLSNEPRGMRRGRSGAREFFGLSRTLHAHKGMVVFKSSDALYFGKLGARGQEFRAQRSEFVRSAEDGKAKLQRTCDGAAIFNILHDTATDTRVGAER